MTFEETKRSLLIELSRKLQSNPEDKISQKRFITIRKAKNHSELNPRLSHQEYAKLINVAYAAATVQGHVAVLIENGTITEAKIAKPGTAGFHSPMSFLL